MKLATMRDGSRDGRLVVVSRDVTQASDARHIAPNLQAALDDWDRLAPHLDLVARGVESGGQPVERFHERDALAPLPRAYRLMEAASDRADAPGVRLRISDGCLGARDPIWLTDDHATDGHATLDHAAGVGALLGDVPMGAGRPEALSAIRLFVLISAPPARADVAVWSPAAFSPVAVTPDELGGEWDGAIPLGALSVEINGQPLEPAVAATGKAIDFGDLIVQAARFGPIGAGAIVAWRPSDPAPLLRAGDTVRIDMRDPAGHTIFGAIERRLERLRRD